MGIHKRLNWWYRPLAEEERGRYRMQSLSLKALNTRKNSKWIITLRILQYNVIKSKDIVMAPLLHDQQIIEYDLLAIQEPWRNPFDNSTTHHRLKDHFHLIYPEGDLT